MIEVSIVTTREDVLGALKTAVGNAGVLCGRRPGTDQDVEKTLPLCSRSLEMSPLWVG